MFRNVLICLLAFLWSLQVKSQLPTSNIYVLDMKLNEVKVVLENPRFLTGFNPEGYNNQPVFLDNEQLLITSNWRANGLTDIYQLNLKNQTLARITATQESEYSPTPDSNGRYLRVVRQEVSNTDNIPQVLWEYPMDRTHGGKALTKNYDQVGYFHFLNDQLVILFLVGPPNKLILYDLENNKESFIAYNIGRTLKKNNGDEFFYVQKIGNTSAIRRYNIEQGKSHLVTYTLSGQEDFEILPNKDFIAGKDGKLYRYSTTSSDGWQEILDLSSLGVKNITRIASSADKIAFVATE